MVTRTGFEPVNDAVKGRCVKPLHQRAKFPLLDYIIISQTTMQEKNHFSSFDFFTSFIQMIYSKFSTIGENYENF